MVAICLFAHISVDSCDGTVIVFIDKSWHRHVHMTFPIQSFFYGWESGDRKMRSSMAFVMADDGFFICGLDTCFIMFVIIVSRLNY